VVRPRLDRRTGLWQFDVYHDDECPQLTWRQRHGATRSYVITAPEGQTVPPQTVQEVAKIFSQQPGVSGVRVGTQTGLSWQQREAIDRQIESDERLKAANQETRQLLEGRFGPHRSDEPLPTWASALLDRFSKRDTPRCEHLRADSAQPWMLSTGLGKWNCRSCVVTQAMKLKAGEISLDADEERTCDRCRRRLEPAEQFTPLVLRENLWTIFGGVCAQCDSEDGT
jgi:hypothetical protein